MNAKVEVEAKAKLADHEAGGFAEFDTGHRSDCQNVTAISTCQ